MTHDLYYYFIVIGLVLLGFNLIVRLLGFDIDSALDFDTDFDFDLDFDLGDVSIQILPVSLMSLSFASVVFGSAGSLLPIGNVIIKNIISGILAYISAVIVGTIVKYLKKHESYSVTLESVRLRNNYVSNKIKENGFGAIRSEFTGTATISMPAKSENGVEIPQGSVVEVIDIKNNVAIVKIKD